MIIKTSPDEIQSYLVDAANYKGSCEAVYFPEKEEDIRSILSDAFKNGTPVTVSGNGTGLTGARVPEGGIVISTEKLNRVIEINNSEHYAIVEPGCLLSALLELFEEKKLLYPPDPTEKNCFIGGTVATNASGEKTFKYGPTRDYVLSLDVILSDGDKVVLPRGKYISKGYDLGIITESGRKIKIKIPDYKMPSVKNASGYYASENMDAIDLFIGSEGTLGIITSIKLKLLEFPDNILSSVVFFAEEKDALNFIIKAREISFCTRNEQTNDIDALALEYFDSNSLKFLEAEYSSIPQTASAAVWFEQESTPENEDTIIEKWSELITSFNGDMDNSWFAFTDADKEKIKGFRHAISAKVNEYISSKGLKKLGTDVAVPDEKLLEFYKFCKTEVKSAELEYVIYGHFGNSHIHLNILPRNIDEITSGKKVYNEICKKAAEWGGTVSAEHGIGKIKTDYLLLMYSEDDIKKMSAVKKVLDPKGILCVGNIFRREFLQ